MLIILSHSFLRRLFLAFVLLFINILVEFRLLWFVDDVANLDVFGKRCEHQACHEGVEASVVALPPVLLILAELRMDVFAVGLEPYMRIVFFISGAFCVQILKIIFAHPFVPRINR